MNGVILNIGLTAAALFLFRMLAGEKFREQLDFLTACVFAVCVLVQIAGGVSAIPFDRYKTLLNDTNTGGYADFSRTTVEEVKRAVAAEMNTRVRGILAEHSVDADKIYVIVNISMWNSISISEVKLVPRGVFPAEVWENLRSQLGDVVVTEVAE